MKEDLILRFSGFSEAPKIARDRRSFYPKVDEGGIAWRHSVYLMGREN
jgi:hypothetical protein